MINLINKKFTDGIRQYKVVEYMEQFKMYRLENYTENRNNQLMKYEAIKNYLDKQDYYIEKYNKSVAYNLRIEEQRKKELKEKEEKEKIYKFCYGYTDNMTSLQAGKILKTLNIQVLYEGNFYTRKELIHLLINKKSRVEIYNNTNRYSKKNGIIEKLKDKTEYRFYIDTKIFLEITKTEYNYIKYLLENEKII